MVTVIVHSDLYLFTVGEKLMFGLEDGSDLPFELEV